MALGALQAIEAAGRKVNEDIYLVGVDALTEAVQNVIDGKQTGTVFNNHFAQAQAASDIAVKFLSGEKLTQSTWLTTRRLLRITLRKSLIC